MIEELKSLQVGGTAEIHFWTEQDTWIVLGFGPTSHRNMEEVVTIENLVTFLTRGRTQNFDFK
jgi:hypothetical protein